MTLAFIKNQREILANSYLGFFFFYVKLMLKLLLVVVFLFLRLLRDILGLPSSVLMECTMSVVYIFKLFLCPQPPAHESRS